MGIRLNLGSGADIREGYINYDIIPMAPSVKQIDLEKDTFDLADNSVYFIVANDFLEHIRDIRHVLNECHRVLSPSGILSVEVPRFPHEDSVKDPTHVRFFIPETFKYFSEYKEACEMYGFKQWKIITQQDSPNRIAVKMSPIK